MAKEEIVRRAVEGVERARGYCDDVEFSPEDASRTEHDFLAEVVERAIEAGAGTVNIPDTVGYAMPSEFASLIRHLMGHVSGIEKIVLSVHCHNDLGLAVANSLASLGEGARQVECTINGIGERAGNCSLEEVVMSLRTRHDHFGLRTGINTERLYPTSRLVSQVTGVHVQRNKAIVGQNAFAHEAGIHQHGVIQNKLTYEIMRPADVGLSKSNLVLGKHSGRHALRERLAELGHQLDKDELNRVFEAFKNLADSKKEIHDADLEELVEGRAQDVPATWELQDLHVASGTAKAPLATVCLRNVDGREVHDAACGSGPVEAVLSAMERITGSDVRLVDYSIRSVTSGRDAEGEVNVEVESKGRRFRGRAVGRDVIEASARAFLNVMNRIAAEQPRRKDVVELSAS
jgi:2-isopropylmalate synthase